MLSLFWSLFLSLSLFLCLSLSLSFKGWAWTCIFTCYYTGWKRPLWDQQVLPQAHTASQRHCWTTISDMFLQISVLNLRPFFFANTSLFSVSCVRCCIKTCFFTSVFYKCLCYHINSKLFVSRPAVHCIVEIAVRTTNQNLETSQKISQKQIT